MNNARWGVGFRSSLAAEVKTGKKRCAQCGGALDDGTSMVRCLDVNGAVIHGRCFEEHLSACGCYGTALAMCQSGYSCGG